MKRYVKRMLTVLLVIFILVFFTTSSTASADSRLSEEEVYEIAVEVGEIYNVCPELLQAMAFYESSYKPNARNGSCIGLMQVSEKWHTERAESLGVTDLYDPYGNMLTAADILMELAREYGDIGVVLMKYNGDSRALENGYLSDYAQKILNMSAELERAHGK